MTPYTCCNGDGGGGETHNHAVAAVVVLSVLEGGGPLTVTARRQGHDAPEGVVTVTLYVVIVVPPVVEPQRCIHLYLLKQQMGTSVEFLACLTLTSLSQYFSTSA